MSTAQVKPDQKCDLCKESLFSSPHFYDAATIYGPWAWLCESCFQKYGRSLVTGVGQQYDSKSYVKTAG